MLEFSDEVLTLVLSNKPSKRNAALQEMCLFLLCFSKEVNPLFCVSCQLVSGEYYIFFLHSRPSSSASGVSSGVGCGGGSIAHWSFLVLQSRVRFFFLISNTGYMQLPFYPLPHGPTVLARHFLRGKLFLTKKKY
jgi:hypothetical protein